MKITSIETFLVNAKPSQAEGWEARNWLFVKVHTDEGIHGVGEASGWTTGSNHLSETKQYA